MNFEVERFKNRKEALLWLRDNGYPVSQGKFYADCAEGFPEIYSDKRVSKFQVLQYAQQLAQKQRPNDSELSQARQEADLKKAIADAKKAEMSADRMEKESSKEWISRKEARQQLAALMLYTYHTVKYHLQRGSSEIIHAVSNPGDFQGTAVEIALEDLLDKAFNEISKQRVVHMEIIAEGES